jgi:hypothetical protein
METQFIDHLTGTAIPYGRLNYEERLSLARLSSICSQAAAAPSLPVRTAAPRSIAASAPVPPITASRPAPASAPPVLPKLTSQQWDERIRKIVKSPLAAGRAELAVMLCSSPCSIDQAIGALRASAADTAAGHPYQTAAEIYARRRSEFARARGEVPAEQPASSSGHLDTGEIFARRHALSAARRTAATQPYSQGYNPPSADSDPHAGSGTNAAEIFARRRTAVAAARLAR